jgi:protease-4
LLVGLLVILLLFSILANLGMGVLLAAFGSPGHLQQTVVEKGQEHQVVALYRIGGLIDERAAATAERFYLDVRDNTAVKAVVLRVETPGGGVGASDRINRIVANLKSKGKKVVVSMGSVAASGGYYVSAGADEIWAEPTTITGSIGVLATLPVLTGTLQKIGVDMKVIRSSPTKAWKAVPDPFEQPAAYQIESLQQTLDAMQTRFEEVVKNGRGARLHVQPEATSQFADAEGKNFSVTSAAPFNGKIYLPPEAMKLGLIDKIGYEEEAIASAASLANLTNPRVVQYAPVQSVFSALMSAKANPLIDAKVLDEVQTPNIMMIWKVE